MSKSTEDLENRLQKVEEELKFFKILTFINLLLMGYLIGRIV